MSKNIVVCCDGTSNQFGPENTNVVKLYSACERGTQSQVAFYDPGVGTFAAAPPVTNAGLKLQKALGLAFGHGITANVLEAYRFLVEVTEPDDRIFMYGFSRGAYAVRVLAGLIHKVGLLERGNENLIPYAERIFKNEHREDVTEAFKHTFGRPCPIHFLGLWDTVSSVGWVFDPETRPFTFRNPSVAVIRHALALDERRAFFRQNRCADDVPGQDLRQVWFPGVHSDVGGANPLAGLALEWMLVESRQAGLLVDDQRAASEIGTPDHCADSIESLTGPWKALEYFPKLRWDSKSKSRKPHMNRSDPRHLQEGECLHASVGERVADRSDYNPPNLPADGKYSVEPRVPIA